MSADRPPCFSVGCYNVLCPTYAVKWNEREGVGPDGTSNWSERWAVMQDILTRASFDVVCLQEVEQLDAESIAASLGAAEGPSAEYVARYFKHEKRPPDGVMIVVRRSAFEDPVFSEMQYNGVAFGCADMRHRTSSCSVRVVTCHCRGGDEKQLAALSDFAARSGGADVTVVAGDFNEDFGAPSESSGWRCPLQAEGEYATMLRGESLPELSRPPHKQAEDQKSGKGKVDWIFVSARPAVGKAKLFRDDASHAAVLESHSPCEATSQWPSDHGAEALSVRLLRN
eukprot:CAMPEP_0115156674 /NCGR_PEP_ID=MMETSP0227-20121206/68588_1 /TAXON_ID=89957 /ORGANISM="Polarella glacialis, Strain CCMP 1383" /LENGTH=283 /DNA_ID=CAMNT_0002567901 /DNA_START=61 /DNA_END=912 /DNA_ORIENTATION=-